MTLELFNSFATFGTFAVIAATAAAALVQLRHLRAGNQINAMLSIEEKVQGSAFSDAMILVRGGLAGALEDPLFREYTAAVSAGRTPPDVPQEFRDLRSAVRLVGNLYESLGLLVKNGTIEATVFLDPYSNTVHLAWTALEKYTAFTREVVGLDALWENFEYVAVLSEDWMRKHPTTYPKGMRRLPLSNPWPVPSVPSPA